MGTTIRSIISHGADGLPVDIECHLANSLPNIVIVGVAGKTVDESRERIRGAFANAGLDLPRKRISINLAPADVPKNSSSLDLPIALAILAAAQQLPAAPGVSDAFIGELGLDGTIRPVRGIIGMLLAGRRHGVKRFYIPSANMAQASVVPGIELAPASHLRQLSQHFLARQPLTVYRTGSGRRTDPETTGSGLPLSDIVGQTSAKRALMIAAAGGHNLLLGGPPGTGKTMLAKALAGLLPPLSHEEMLEVTHLHSLARRDFGRLITTRPFRAPHHSASHSAVVGGGAMVRPGEVSLAHRGVLFFDELPEFARPTIEALRQPLEERTISVARAKESSRFPANFIFVATANPCPCGYANAGAASPDKTCQCPAHLVRSYQRKLSGPLLDRIDIGVAVGQVDHSKLLVEKTPHDGDNDDTASIIRMVTEARSRQHRRLGGRRLNSEMSNGDIRRHARLTTSARQVLDQAASGLDLSARSYLRSLKVARTIADLAGSDVIGQTHISEALHYRPQAALAG